MFHLCYKCNKYLYLCYKSGFKRTIKWNKYQSKVPLQEQNPYLDYIIDRSFQRVNTIFVLPFENDTDRTVHAEYYFLILEMKDYNVMIDGQNVFDESVKMILEHMITCQNLRLVMEMITLLLVY